MNDMTLIQPFAAISLCILGAIIILHILPAFVRAGGHALGFVCLGLHIPLMPLMLLGGFPLEVMILAYAASAFLFTLVRLVTYERSLRRAGKTEMKEDEDK